MIIVLGSQKGGVGKSTLAVSIAAYLMSLGNRVIIVDADVQMAILSC
ncbi:ParA family protein [Escherichia coli]|nr:ParA family protein [Escherichia coli]